MRRFAQDDGFVEGLKKRKHPFRCAEKAKRLKSNGSQDHDFCGIFVERHPKQVSVLIRRRPEFEQPLGRGVLKQTLNY